MWISDVLLPVLFWQTLGCAPVPVPPDEAAPEPPGPVLAPPDGLQAAIAIAAAPTSTPRFLSFIQTPPYHDRPEDPERSPVGPPGSVRSPARNRHRRPARVPGSSTPRVRSGRWDAGGGAQQRRSSSRLRA